MSSTSSNNSQPAGCLDPLDSLLDLSEYETVPYQSPSLSPESTKARFTTRSVSHTPATLPPSSQSALTGPSHNYDLYRQQTGIPPGAVANTLAVNSYNAHLSQYNFGDSFPSLSSNDDFIDFGTAPGRTGSYNPSETDMEFDSPKAEPAFFYPESSADYIDPSTIGASLPTITVPSQPTPVGRVWPGMHQQQAAVAKAQAQQRQQQEQLSGKRGQSGQPQRARPSHPPTDALVEEKISQLLNSMRQSSVNTEGDDSHVSGSVAYAQRMRKDEEEMDEDERLLASEEGKKLSSKERRQLRNKVSARAFRSRRKEYIGQLEGEISAKVNENSDLRAQNRALMEENTRLTDLTRMLLSSPSFSGFLDALAQNSTGVQQPPASTPAPVPSQRPENRQARKDVNPYAAQQQTQEQQIGMAMIPENTMDFSMMDLNAGGAFPYQPQVFSVLDISETVIDSEILSGKATSLPLLLSSEDVKVELPVVERALIAPLAELKVIDTEPVDEEFDADPAFALFAAPTTPASKPWDIDAVQSLLAAIPTKQEQFRLVVEPSVSEDEAEATMRKVDRLCDSMERVADNLRLLTINL